MKWSGNNNMKINTTKSKKTNEFFIYFNRCPSTVPSVKGYDVDLERVCHSARPSTHQRPEIQHLQTIELNDYRREYNASTCKRVHRLLGHITNIVLTNHISAWIFIACMECWTNARTIGLNRHVQERAMKFAFPILQNPDALKAADLEAVSPIVMLCSRKCRTQEINCTEQYLYQWNKNPHKVTTRIAHGNRYKNSVIWYVLVNCQTVCRDNRKMYETCIVIHSSNMCLNIILCTHSVIHCMMAWSTVFLYMVVVFNY